MLTDMQQELLDSFSEVGAIGQDLAEKINAWNGANMDEDNPICVIGQEMSGDTVVSCYTENGIEESVVCKMLEDIGYSASEESDDTVVYDIEVKKSKDVSDWLNDFLVKCIEVSERYPSFVGAIELLAGNSLRKEEVRIVIPSNVDIRKLPSRDIRKAVFMNFLKDVREVAQKYSMIDEAFCFCASKNEFLVMLHPYRAKKQP